MADQEQVRTPTFCDAPRALPPTLPPALPQQPHEPQPALPSELPPHRVAERTKTWFSEEGPWWICSFVFHLLLICSLALLGGRATRNVLDLGEAAAFEEVKGQPSKDTNEPLRKIEHLDTSVPPEDPEKGVLNLELTTVKVMPPGVQGDREDFIDDRPGYKPTIAGGGMAGSSTQPNLGGLGGFDIRGFGAGPAVVGRGGGVGVGIGTGKGPGMGGSGTGFGQRGYGRKTALASGATRQSELAVARAVDWIARHQLANGSWSLANFGGHCKDATCTGLGNAGARPGAATALGLLPFLAAGQTHQTNSRYRRNIAAGVQFLVSHQKPDGDLRIGPFAQMYDHGLAAIALCECYGMSNDKAIRNAAQLALNFIAAAQDPIDGGWRYYPRETPGDTSVAGWQIMALKSGRMASLAVSESGFDKSKIFLKSVSSRSYNGGRFTYLPDGSLVGTDLAVTAVGLLCQQYMGMAKDDPAMIEGTGYLMQHPPDEDGPRNLYYWYYATQVMHNQPGPQWDEWNRKIRHVLIAAQCRDGCAAGSWDPALPKQDMQGRHGGRLMMTSLAALTLEVYYRFMPLYQLDRPKDEAAPAADKAKKEK